MEARLNQNKRDETYRFYISNALQVISESAAKLTGGLYMTKSLYDVYNPVEEPKRETEQPQTAEQLAMGIWSRMTKKGR